MPQTYPTARRAAQTFRQPVAFKAPYNNPDFVREKKLFEYPAKPANDNRPKRKAKGPPKGPTTGKWVRAANGLWRFLNPTQVILDALGTVGDQYMTAPIDQLNMAGWSAAGVCRTLPVDGIMTWTSCARPFTPGVIDPGDIIPGSRTQIMTYNLDYSIPTRPWLPVRIWTRNAQAQPQPNPWRVIPSVVLTPDESAWPWPEPAYQPIWGNPYRTPFHYGFLTVKADPDHGYHPPGRTRPTPPVKPPPKGVREGKAAITGWAGFAYWLASQGVNYATEATDVVMALWYALPASLRTKLWFSEGYTNPFEKAQLIWEHADQLDWGQAVTNLVQNQIEDYVIGKIGSKVGEASHLRGSPLGYQAGPAL